jgi:uncharacterized C2H2 Zn-finger protein
MNDKISCEYCNTILKNKYNLKAHLNNNKTCLNIRSIPFDNKFICNGCDSIFTLKTNFTKHINKCKSYNKVIKEQKEQKEQKENISIELKILYEKEINNIKQTYEKNIIDLQLQNEKQNNEIKQIHKKNIFELKQDHERTIKELQLQNEKLLTAFEKLATHAVDRPTTINNNNNNIRNNFSDKYFVDTLKNEDIKHVCINYLTEQVFFEGQKGIAQLCTDHIIKTKDNKALLICTDTSRKKFKYLDENRNLNEDHEARIFTEKVSKPIKDASKVLYENILSDVNYERENLEEDEVGKKEKLHYKTMKAIDCMMNITNFDDPKYNTEFKNELAVLNK